MPTPNVTGTPVSVSILGRDFQMMCPEGERQSLLDAAQFIDDRMREIRDSGKVIGMDRIAVLVAINLANEYLSNSGSTEDYASDVHKKVSKLCDKISYNLAQYKQLEL